jgi:hypothetical protein
MSETKFHTHTTLSLFQPNILLSILFLNTFSLCSFLNVRDQVSHPYRTIGKIIGLYIPIFMCLDSSREDKRFLTENDFNYIPVIYGDSVAN